MPDALRMIKKRDTVNLFELMEAIDVIDERVKVVEKYSHEPQNYKKKCDEMEGKIKKLEQIN